MANVHPWAQPYYDVVGQFRLDAAAQQDFDEYFTRVNALASSCPDQSAFLNQFMQGPLFNEFNQLMEKYQQQFVTPSGETVEEAAATLRRESAEASAADHAKTMAEQKLNEVVSQVLPDEINRLRWGGLRAIPVIRPIMQWIDNLQWLRGLFGNK